MRHCIWLLTLLTLTLAACSDDTKPPAAEKSLVSDRGNLPTGDAMTLLPDSPPRLPDAQAWGCTAGGANMCNGYKTQYCKDGVCTDCPNFATDCDRQGDCECNGVCDGTKCKAP